MPDVDSPRGPSKADSSGLVKELWQTGIWKLFLLLFLYIAGPTAFDVAQQLFIALRSACA